MAGPEEVVAGIKRRDGVVYAGLVLNERGYDRLLAAQLDEVHFSFAASETFNRRNGEGIEAGVDLDALIDVAVWLEELLGEELSQSGLPGWAVPARRQEPLKVRLWCTSPCGLTLR